MPDEISLPGSENDGSEEPDASEGSGGSRLSVLGGYLANHTVHVAVVVLLGLYPGIHHVVTAFIPAADFILHRSA